MQFYIASHHADVPKAQLEKQIKELTEDKDKTLMFKLGFILLKVFNLALRLENKDWPRIDFDKVDVSKFYYDLEDYEDYRKQKPEAEKATTEQQFILEKIRNAVCHGHIEFEGVSNLSYVVFKDEWHQREVMIKILSDDLDDFLEQECLYENTPQKTLIYEIAKKF